MSKNNSLKSKENKKSKRWWDDDGDGIGWEKGEVSGKFDKKSKVKEALDPVGQEDSDIDNDGESNTKKDKYLLNRRRVRSKAISMKKESFSNWRGEISEIAEIVPDEKSKQKVKEKKVNNKITINPKISETVENLGGTLIEMTEIENFEGIFDDLSESEIFFLNTDIIEEVVGEVFLECLEEGYEYSDIQNTLLESLEISTEILDEAKVTYGHDTKIKSDRLEKVKSAVKETGKSVASKASSAKGLLSRVGSKLKSGLKKIIAKGARKVAKGALGVARRVEKEKPSTVHSKSGTRSPNLRSGIGGGKRIEVAGSGKSDTEVKKVSVKDVTPKKEEPPAGTSENPRVGKPGPEKPKTTEKTTKVTSRKPRKKPTASATSKKSGRKSEPNPKKPGAPSLDDLLKSEEFNQITEKTLTDAETKKREELVKSMKKNLKDFESRYPGRGKEVMYATATKMAKKMAEQALELQPKAQPPQKEKPLDTSLERQKYSNLRMMQQKQQQLQKQRLNLQKQGKLPLETD